MSGLENALCNFNEIQSRMIKIYPSSKNGQTVFKFRFLNPFLETKFFVSYLRRLNALEKGPSGVKNNLLMFDAEKR